MAQSKTNQALVSGLNAIKSSVGLTPQQTNALKTTTQQPQSTSQALASGLNAVTSGIGFNQQQLNALNNKAQQAQNQFDLDAFMAKLNKQNQSYLNALNQQNQNIEARINALNQAKQAQAVADLGKARDASLSNLSSEESAIKPTYYDKRNSTAATNMIGRRTLAEELASRGESNSGVADQANISANMSLQGETGALNRQEASDIADIARRRTGVQNAYESDVASAKAGLEAAAMQNLIDQYNSDRLFKLQEAGVTGNYNGTQTLDALNAARNYALNEAGITGVYKGSKTQDSLNADRNYALNEANLTGLYNGNKTLAAQNQSFNQNLATQQFNQEKQQQKLDNLYRQQTFDYQKSRDAVSDNQWQQQMNLNLRQQSYQEAQQKIENALSQRRISQEDASQALQWAKFNADQDPNSIDNQLKKQQIDTNTQTKITSQVNSVIDNYNNLYTTKKYNKDTGETSMTADKKSILDSIKASVQSGKMTEDIARQVAGYYGISL